MKFYKKKSIAGFFILVNLLFLTQGLMPILDTFYSILLFLIIAISIVYFFKVNSEYGSSKFIVALNLFVLLITIYGVINIISPTTPMPLANYRPHTFLTNAYRPLLPIYPLYYFSRKGFVDEEVIRNWVLPSFVVAVIAFYVSNKTEGFAMAIQDVEKTNNVGYLIVSTFPLLYFINRSYIQYVLLAFISVLVFICAKRGAILIAGLLIVWFLYNDLKNSSARKKVWTLSLALFVAAFLFVSLTKIFEESYYLNYLYEKTSEGNSSGRDILYTKAWDIFINSNIEIFLIGNGADSTFGILGNRAHNDWLEIIVNHGFVGLLIFFYLWVQIIKSCIKSKCEKRLYRIFVSVLIVFFLKTFFSMWYNDLSPIACLPFAWCIALMDSSRKMKIKYNVVIQKLFIIHKCR